MPGVGHNSGEAQASPDVLAGVAQTQLKSLVARIQRLNEDKAGVMQDIKEVYAEVKGHGFDAKIVRKMIRIAAMDRAKRQEEEALLDLYMSAADLL